MTKRKVSGTRALFPGQRRAIRRDLLIKYGPYCQLCLVWGKDADFARIDLETQREAKSFSLDHITPTCQGGTNDQENLWPTHVACNEQRKELPLTVKVEVDFTRNTGKVKSESRKSKARLTYSSTSSGY